MTLSDLNPHELRVFMGLFKLMVHADREVSDEERDLIAQFAETLGIQTWNDAVAAAREAYVTVEQLEVDAKAMSRPAARSLIHRALAELAHCDQLVDAEAHVLRWMTENWGAPPSPAPRETFVLIED